jgi:hypothetical protein
VAHQISADELAAFRGCRRRWDFSSANRMNLEHIDSRPVFDLGRAVKDALAIFYFPGMWDWPREIVLPLVFKGFERSMQDQRTRYASERSISGSEDERWRQNLDDGRRLLEDYVDWAPTADRFGPILVETDYVAPVPDPWRPGESLATEHGRPVHYVGRADALVIDEFDAYWILRHRVVDEWTPIEQLSLDEVSIAACWAWENFYLGMAIRGTIDNELRLRRTGEPVDRTHAEGPGTDPRAGSEQPGVRPRILQSDGSGGGRSVPQHRRMSAQAKEPDASPRVEEQDGPGFHRTWIRRRPAEIASGGSRLAREAVYMIDPSVFPYPSPSIAQCGTCAYLRPCLTTNEGLDPTVALAEGYHRRPEIEIPETRLGSVTWSTGRGAAPPHFGRSTG